MFYKSIGYLPNKVIGIEVNWIWRAFGIGFNLDFHPSDMSIWWLELNLTFLHIKIHHETY